MPDENPIFWLIIFGMALGIGVAYGVYDLAFRPAPSPEQQWVSQHAERCRAMRSRISYNEQTRTVECYRTPLLRKPKLMFKETYQGQ